MHRILIAFVAFLIATSVPAQSSAQGSLATPISIVNANKVTERLTLKGSIDTFPDVQFSPDGANLASLEIDQFSNTQDGNLYVWDAPDFKTKSQIALELGKLRAYNFNLDNQTIVTGNYHGDIGIYYRISQSQMKVGEVAAPINRIAAGGQLAAIATGYLYDTLLTLQEPQSNFAFWLWDLSNQTEFLSISKCNDENQVCIGAGIATAYSVDGRFYAFATNKGIIQNI